MLNKHNVISGNNFSAFADVVFSERVSKNIYPEIKKGNFYKIIERVENDFSSDVWFINKKITLNKNSTIFCKTEALELLFLIIKDVPKEYELNLISHQSDISIDQKLFNKKPECIKEWYAINVAYNHKNLHHIPLGISEEFRKKHLNVDYLDEMLKPNYSEINNSIYINYNQNTNEKIRSKIFKKLKNASFINVGSYGSEIKEYIKDLKCNKYILCPTGNGLDTYRLWESLIVGSYPVVNSVENYLEFRNLPIYFFDDASKLNIEFLDSNSDLIEKLQNENKDKEYLFAEYWVKNIKKEKENNNEVEEMVIIIDENLEKRYFRKFFIIKAFKSNLKIVRFYIYQYLNIFNYFRFILRKFDLIDDKSF